MLTSESPADGWTAIADQDLKAKLEETWVRNRSFYARIAPAFEGVETGDNHLLTLPASQARVTRIVVGMVEAFRKLDRQTARLRLPTGLSKWRVNSGP